ncbi:hypothetical protein STEG23_001482 [Scotinomys teguina]
MSKPENSHSDHCQPTTALVMKPIERIPEARKFNSAMGHEMCERAVFENSKGKSMNQQQDKNDPTLSTHIPRDTGSHYVFLVGLELPNVGQASLNSQRSTCLCLPSIGTKGVFSLNVCLMSLGVRRGYQVPGPEAVAYHVDAENGT